MSDHTTTIGDGFAVEWHPNDAVAIVQPDPDPFSIWKNTIIEMGPQTALNLLDWLRDEEATLQRLAERERA